MSGGQWDYIQHKIDEAALDLKYIIEDNNHAANIRAEDGKAFNPQTIAHFKNAMNAAYLAAIYLHEIDYLLSGDTGEEFFVKHLEDRLAKHLKRRGIE